MASAGRTLHAGSGYGDGLIDDRFIGHPDGNIDMDGADFLAIAPRFLLGSIWVGLACRAGLPQTLSRPSCGTYPE